jgi:hypothetical protein
MHPNEMHFAYTRVRLWQTVEPQSVMTTEKEVVEPPMIKPKSTSARNIFSKTNAATGSALMNFVTFDQLLRTHNQKNNV